MPSPKLTEAQARALKAIRDDAVFFDVFDGRYRSHFPGVRADTVERLLGDELATVVRRHAVLTDAGREALREWEAAHA